VATGALNSTLIVRVDIQCQYINFDEVPGQRWSSKDRELW